MELTAGSANPSALLWLALCKPFPSNTSCFGPVNCETFRYSMIMQEKREGPWCEFENAKANVLHLGHIRTPAPKNNAPLGLMEGEREAEPEADGETLPVGDGDAEAVRGSREAGKSKRKQGQRNSAACWAFSSRVVNLRTSVAHPASAPTPWRTALPIDVGLAALLRDFSWCTKPAWGSRR